MQDLFCKALGCTRNRMKKHVFLGFLLTWTALTGSVLPAQAAPTPAERSTSVPLAPDAPSEYTVKPGDTLWGIAGKFLSQPWYWPEIWYLNTEIANPHLIYPGDIIRLVYDAAGKPRLILERGDSDKVVHLSPQIRTSNLGSAIPAIPYDIVAAFMSKPSVISKEEARNLPYITALNEDHVAGGVTDKIYARNLPTQPIGTRFNLVRLGRALKDPDSGAFLGYEGIYTGSARLDRAAANSKNHKDFARLTIMESGRETLAGDRILLPPADIALDFVPHAPRVPVSGQIIAVMDGINIVGQYEAVAINRGSSDGLEPGAMLEIFAHGYTAKDRGHGGITRSQEFTGLTTPTVALPAEISGTFMVFKTYQHMSYGLVLTLHGPSHVGDVVKNP